MSLIIPVQTFTAKRCWYAWTSVLLGFHAPIYALLWRFKTLRITVNAIFLFCLELVGVLRDHMQYTQNAGTMYTEGSFSRLDICLRVPVKFPQIAFLYNGRACSAFSPDMTTYLESSCLTQSAVQNMACLTSAWGAIRVNLYRMSWISIRWDIYVTHNGHFCVSNRFIFLLQRYYTWNDYPSLSSVSLRSSPSSGRSLHFRTQVPE